MSSGAVIIVASPNRPNFSPVQALVATSGSASVGTWHVHHGYDPIAGHAREHKMI